MWRVPATGGDPVRLTPPERSAGYPSWSPDGQRLALEVDDGGTTQVWVVNRDGSGLRRVTTTPGQHWPHSWAPDNDRIAFAGERDGDLERVDGLDLDRSGAAADEVLDAERLRQLPGLVTAQRPHRLRARHGHGQCVDGAAARRHAAVGSVTEASSNG